MLEFDKTILIKFNNVWQTADANINVNDGKVAFKINGRVYYITDGMKYQSFTRLLTDKEKNIVTVDANLNEFFDVIETEKRKEREAIQSRLNQYRIRQMIRSMEASNS